VTKYAALLTCLCFAALQSAFSAPVYMSATLTSLNGQWSPATGSLQFSGSGLQSSSSGALITSVDPSGPDQGGAGPYEYEVRTTYRLTQSGGNYVNYFAPRRTRI
jgi:hypothetical protein